MLRRPSVQVGVSAEIVGILATSRPHVSSLGSLAGGPVIQALISPSDFQLDCHWNWIWPSAGLQSVFSEIDC